MRSLSPWTTNPILDPGAPVSFAGLESATAFTELSGIELSLSTPSVPRRHGFGPEGKSGGDVMAVWTCVVSDLHGNDAKFVFDIIPGNAPLLIGLDYDKEANTSSLTTPPTWNVRMGGKLFEFGVYVSRDQSGNLRRFVEFRPRPQSLLSFLSRAQRNQGAVKMAREEPRRFAMRLHGWSHFSLEQMRRLCRQSGVHNPEVDAELCRVVERCASCPMTGSNIGSAGLRRVSLTKHLHPEGNRMLEIDHVSHVVSMSPTVREQLCLSMACNSTGYGETAQVASKSLPAAIGAIEMSWVLRHGAPESIAADPGLGGKVMNDFCAQHSVVWESRPPRRHNTVGVVERRNGVMRMILARIVAANDTLPESEQSTDSLLLERANFLVNLILGDETLSSFQLLKGYQPSLVGMPTTSLAPENVQAHLQISSQRALSRMLRSKSFNPYTKPPLSVGQIILIHTQRQTGSARGSVGWAQHKVVRIDRDMVASRPLGRDKGKLNLTSFADVRVPPSNPIAQSAFNFMLQQPLPSSSRLGRCVANDSVADDDAPPQVPPVPQAVADDAPPPPPQPSNSLAVENENVQSVNAQQEPESEQEVENASRVPAVTEAQPEERNVRRSARVARNQQREACFLAGTQALEEIKAFYSRLEAAALTRNPSDVGDGQKDIGMTLPQSEEPNEHDINFTHNVTLQPHDMQKACEDILQTVGRESCTRAKLSFVAPWILDDALAAELEGWDKYITVEPLPPAPVRKSVIGSHVVYCVKTREDGSHYLKARLVIHGNEEKDKEDLRSDASALQFAHVRLLLSMAVILQFVIGGVDVSKAYHQSGGPPREIRIRPPAECLMYRVLWRLLSLPYGLVDAGRQWQLSMESWLLDEQRFVTFGGLPQVFAKLDHAGAIVLLMGKISDDLLVAGRRAAIEEFFAALHSRWEIGKSVISDDLLFNGARILRNEHSGDISLSMNEYLSTRVQLLSLTRDRRKEESSSATDAEKNEYRSAAGTLNFLGTAALPQASFVASVFLQRQSNLTVYDLTIGNRMIAELKKMNAVVCFKSPPRSASSVKLLAFSDASFNIIGGNSYGQSGYVSGLVFGSDADKVFHVYDWYSSKQKRVVYSSFGAEILACADADNRLYGLKIGLASLTSEEIISELLVDSKSLFTCVTTLSDQREYRLRRTVARIRESFDSRELDHLRWVSGNSNLADAVTKWNPQVWELLQVVLNAGVLPSEVLQGVVRGDDPSWRRNLPELHRQQ